MIVVLTQFKLNVDSETSDAATVTLFALPLRLALAA